MKKIILAISFLFICLFSNAQENNKLNKMINESLLSYINWISDLTSKTCKNCEEHAFYICIDNYLNNFSFSEEILNKNVKFISLTNLKGLPNSFRSKLKKGITTLFVGINLSNNQLEIRVSDKELKLKGKKHLYIAISNWGIYTYEYVCDKQEWELKETKYGGV
jgi:hypothetical protein